jgi:hypothetical protein
LCQNSNFLTFDDRQLEEDGTTVAIGGDYGILSGFYNLGSFISPIEDVDANTSEQEMIENISSLTKDRYVVIGNFVEGDIHDTYIGEKAGSLILMRALQTLEAGDNIVSIRHIISWLIIFFVMSILIVNNESILNYIPFFRHARYKLLHYVVDVLSFTFFLLLCGVAEYICSDKVYSLSVPIIYFSIVKLYYHYKYFKFNEK